METREDRLYEDFKRDVTAAAAQMEGWISTAQSTLSNLSTAADRVGNLLHSVQDNPLLEKRAAIRRKIWPLVPVSHTMEICLDVNMHSLLAPLRSSLEKLVGKNADLLETEIATSASGLSRSEHLVDHLVFSQKLRIRAHSMLSASEESLASAANDDVHEATTGVEILVKQPLFVKLKQGGPVRSAIAALTTPTVTSDSQEGEILASALQAKIISQLFAGEIGAEIPVYLPSEFAARGLLPYAVRLQDGIGRIYYSNRRKTPLTPDSPAPRSPQHINIKLSLQLLDGFVRPKVSHQMAESNTELQSLKVHLDENSQVMHVIVVGSQRVWKYIGNVKFWGKGFAKVRQSVRLTSDALGRLEVRSLGPPQLLGEPWVGEAGAHMDTPIGGGVGVSLPDEAVDILWAIARELGVRLPMALPNSTFDEAIDLTPLRLVDSVIRSAYVLLSAVEPAFVAPGTATGLAPLQGAQLNPLLPPQIVPSAQDGSQGR